MNPTFSIITPSLNQGAFIEHTIQSVLAQNFTSLEYRVIDGGSVDGSIEILRRFEKDVRWISESDAGQADAINKGFKNCRGEILAWLNADDYYAPGTLESVSQIFSRNPDIMLLYGDGGITGDAGEECGIYPSEAFDLDRLASKCIICQPAAFFRRELWSEIGPLDTSLHFAMDFDFWLRAGKARQKHPEWRFEYVPKIFAYSRMHAGAKTFAAHREFLIEIKRVVKHHFGFVPYSWIYGLEEIRDPRYDGVMHKSPVSVGLIVRSLAKWIWQNKSRPDHIVRFAGQVLRAPLKSVRELRARAH